jgi:LmbE family N-acetylglucosaminyl deacetylase
MEDHMMTARLAVSATFARGIPNYRSLPSRPPVLQSCTLYHAMPHGLHSPMRVPVQPECYIDTTSVQSVKRDALACHASQREWLDTTQGMDSYVETMDSFSRALGKQSRKFQHAEGWSRHLHHGFGAAEDDPLRDALGAKRIKNRAALA